MCSTYSCLKYLIVLSTGLGALCPRPHREPFWMSLPSSIRRSISPCCPCPVVMASRISSICDVPILQGGHLPHDSDCVNERKYFAISTMQVSSSSTTIPPDPIIDPTLVSESKSTGSSSWLAGIQPPEGPPVCIALNSRSSKIPPPIS